MGQFASIIQKAEQIIHMDTFNPLSFLLDDFHCINLLDSYSPKNLNTILKGTTHIRYHYDFLFHSPFTSSTYT